MRGVRLLGDRRVAVDSFPDPEPGPGEAVIEIRVAGLCGSDLQPYRAPAASGESRPVIAGHEPCGVVVGLGKGVEGVTIGSRVVVNHHFGCRACIWCSAGLPKFCTGESGTYGVSHDGADAEYMVAKASALVQMPDSLGFEEGAMVACGVGTAFAALRRLQLAAGETIAIFGQGPVGLGATTLAASMGARVIAVDTVDERLALAVASGAEVVVDARMGDAAESVLAMTSAGGADAALDCSGAGEGRAAATRSVRIHGRVCFVGVGPPSELDVSEVIIGKELTCYGSWTFTSSCLAECMAFVDERSLPLANLITHRVALEYAAEAFSAFDEGCTGKVVLVSPKRGF